MKLSLLQIAEILNFDPQQTLNLNLESIQKEKWWIKILFACLFQRVIITPFLDQKLYHPVQVLYQFCFYGKVHNCDKLLWNRMSNTKKI